MNFPSPGKDAERPLRAAAEIARTCKLLRAARLQAAGQSLSAIYQEYKNAPGRILRPDTDAVLWGFQGDWREGGRAGIVRVGDRLDPGVWAGNREAQAYYLAAKSLLPADLAGGGGP